MGLIKKVRVRCVEELHWHAPTARIPKMHMDALRLYSSSHETSKPVPVTSADHLLESGATHLLGRILQQKCGQRGGPGVHMEGVVQVEHHVTQEAQELPCVLLALGGHENLHIRSGLPAYRGPMHGGAQDDSEAHERRVENQKGALLRKLVGHENTSRFTTQAERVQAEDMRYVAEQDTCDDAQKRLLTTLPQESHNISVTPGVQNNDAIKKGMHQVHGSAGSFKHGQPHGTECPKNQIDMQIVNEQEP
mmetsp:Transcript_37602/g.99980  ORF Transcript_37602/g.99980 Transcript_37602/m.99980 type:complete len:249 (-) Transcript_37602:430-1176(-)